ncbi:MAG: hypothetical protein ACJ8AJ_12235 [Gemmatimonadaceae bacterium]
MVIQLTQTQKGKPYRLPLEVGLAADSAAGLRIEKIDLTQENQRFEIAADRAPSDVALDPNTWMLMEPPKFSRRQP